MNESQILNRCKELAKECFQVEFNELVRISGRMTATAAKVTFKRITMSGRSSYSIVDLAFAKNVFQNTNYPQIELDKIIKHELVHWYLLKFKQIDCGHDGLFKQMCYAIGADVGYAGSEIKTKTERYAIVCSHCGKVAATRARKPSDKLMKGSISSCCKAALYDMGQVDLGTYTNQDITDSYVSTYREAALKNK